jgi:hypothetical protein
VADNHLTVRPNENRLELAVASKARFESGGVLIGPPGSDCGGLGLYHLLLSFEITAKMEKSSRDDFSTLT